MARRQRLDRHPAHRGGRSEIGRRAGCPLSGRGHAVLSTPARRGPTSTPLMVRRRVAAGVAIVLLIVIVLLINGCLKSEKQQSLKNYNRDVSQIAQESDAQVSHPLFVALTNSTSKSALDVEVQIDELLKQAQTIAARAKGLSVPGEMAAAQRDLLLALDLRVEGMTKVAALVPTALGGQAKQDSTKIAGDMEIFLASDVIYSQRVAPLIQQTLAANGIQGLTTASTRFLPNLGWLEAATTLSRITGQAASSSASGRGAPGHHGSALKGVSVGTTTLEAEPALNHISGGSNPTFTVMVENDGEFPETDVKVDVTVTAGGKQLKASHVINTTEPGKTVNVEIPVPGVPLRRAREGRSPGRAGARRNQPRRHQGHLPGDLRRIGRPVPGRRAAAGRARGEPRARRQRLTCGDGRIDHRHPGNHRDRGGARWRSRRCAACAALSVGLRRLRRAQRLVLGERQERDVVAHAAAMQEAFEALRAYVEETRHAPGRAPRRRGGGPAGTDRAPRARALRRLQRAVRAPVDVDRAAGRRTVGHRALVHPPPRSGARVRQAGARRARRTGALSRGGRGRAPGPGRRRGRVGWG